MNTFQSVGRQFAKHSIEALLGLRALYFVGNRYICPCCGSRLRAFTHGGFSMRVRPLGYCPRCNSKARHRRWWLFLQQETDLFTKQTKLYQIAPNYCMSRRFGVLPNIDYVVGDYNTHRNISQSMALPTPLLNPDAFDVVLCIHVLEHIQDDRGAIHELYRVLKPGGWAGFSVPIRLGQKTDEDPRITSPRERERAFGETVHVRYYGYDFADRLEEAGFQVSMYAGKDVEAQSRQIYGLRDDENIFLCSKQ